MKRLLFFVFFLVSGVSAQAALVLEGVLDPGSGALGYGAAAIDPGAGYAYFLDTGTYITHISPPRQIHVLDRIRLSDFSLSLSETGISSFTSATIQQTNNVALIGVGPFSCGVIDPEEDFAYFGSETNPAKIIKVRLSDLALMGTITLPAAQAYLRAATIDTRHHFAYFGSSTTTGSIVKIDLENFTVASTLSFPGAGAVASAVLDTVANTGWFGTIDKPGKVVRVNLNTMQVTNTLTLNIGENHLTSAIYDPEDRLIYFGTETSSGVVVRVRALAMNRDRFIKLNASEGGFLQTAVWDSINNYAYFGSRTIPGKITKIDLIGGVPEITSIAQVEQEVPVGEPANFYITATGRDIAYQWNRDGAPIAGANTEHYQIPQTTLNDDGARFNCTVSNSSGSATSGETFLTVQPDIHVFPNPWRADRNTGVPLSFNGLPTGSVVKIFSTAAHWVQSVSETGGVAAWDLKNSGGQNAASGYYFYYVKTRNDRHQIRGKFAIIR